MPSKRFTDFSLNTAPLSGDFIVGYNSDGSAEFRLTVDTLFEYFVARLALSTPTAPIEVPLVPTYTLSSEPSIVTEGSVVVFTMDTTNVDNGTVIPYVISGSGITSGDIGGTSLTGSFIVQNNTASVALNVTSDLISESSEVLIMSAADQVASVTINDPVIVGVGSLQLQNGVNFTLENTQVMLLQA